MDKYRVKVPHIWQEIGQQGLVFELMLMKPTNDNDRPIYLGWMLNDELHSWFIDQNIDYKLFRTEKFIMDKNGNIDCWYIEFNKPNDAMIYKLSWI